MRRSVQHLIRDERGAIVVWATVGMFGFFAVGALLLDAGRMLNLHSQMQSYADHAALAAAAELAGDGTAIGRAISAATGGAAGPVVTDTQNYSFGSANLSIASMTFLSKLGTGQQRAGELISGDVVQYMHTAGATPSYTTEQSRVSRFVQVIVSPRDVTFVMAPILTALGIGSASASASAPVSAGAVAGFTRAACRFPPLMMCNPMENPAGGGKFDWEALMGRQVLLKSQSGGAQWAPGNYGLLDLSDYNTSGCSGNGANLIRCVLAHRDPGTQCVLQGGNVDLKPGNTVGPTRQGMNIRFDIWDPPMHNDQNNANFAPARNVIKGKTHDNNKCREQDLTDGPSVALPQDTGLSDANRIGNGVPLSALQSYWTTNHPTVAWPFASGVKPTRYEIYRKEIELNTATAGETMGPTCAAPVSEPAGMDMVKDRRVMIVAVVNCIEQGVHGSMNDVPVENFGVMFITEPVVEDVGTGGDGIVGEMLGVVKANTSNGVLHEFPVLYR